MELIIQLSETLDKETMDRNRNLQLTIYWRFPDFDYPMNGWTDFGVVLLGWWVQAIVSLRQGSQETDLLFMDGPYSVHINKKAIGGEISLIPKGYNVEIASTILDITNILIKSSNSIYLQLLQEDMLSQERESVQKYIQLLRYS
jgi:hypothetical protein